jgi:hypothetical protein
MANAINDRKVPYLTLYFPAIAAIRVYVLDDRGLRLIRTLTGAAPKN